MIPAPSTRNIHMAAWNIDLTVVQDADGLYFSVRELCGIFGISKVPQMIARMQEDDILAECMRKYPLNTKGGRQLSWCIQKRAIAYWLGTISLQKIRPEFQLNIRELKLQALDFMDRLLWGEVDATSSPVVANSTSLSTQISEIAEEHDSTRALLLHLEDRVGKIESQIRFEPEESEG